MYVLVSATFVLLAVSATFGQDIPFAPGLGLEELLKSMEFMQKYDYIHIDAGKDSGDGLDIPMVKAGIDRFQTFHGLPRTGVIDADTAALMEQPRCGCRDPEFHGDAEREEFRYGTEGGKWNKTALTFRITRIPTELSKKAVRRTVKDACRVWSGRSPLKFTEVRSGNADITIKFMGDMNHGDRRPFGHPMGEVAHGFPPTDRDLPGEIHLDASENFGFGKERDGINLHQLLVHELGHALGLGHSPNPQSVMYPILKPRDDPDYDLSRDDMAGMHALYGRKSRLRHSSHRARKQRKI